MKARMPIGSSVMCVHVKVASTLPGGGGKQTSAFRYLDLRAFSDLSLRMGSFALKALAVV